LHVLPGLLFFSASHLLIAPYEAKVHSSFDRGIKQEFHLDFAATRAHFKGNDRFCLSLL
jgi:hypothetical protein